MRFLVLIASMFLFATIAYGGQVTGTAEFDASATPGFLQFTGTGGVLSGAVTLTDGKASGTFEVDLQNIDTGIGLRNEHLRDKYLETKTFPKATLVLNPTVVSETEFAWTGSLTIKGETKPVSGVATVKGGDLWATFTIKLSDFPKVGAPAYQLVKVADEIKVTVNAKHQ